MEKPKHAGGRPKAANPLEIDCKVRLDAATAEQLEAYCTRHGVKKAQAIRAAVRMMLAADADPAQPGS